MLKFLKFLKKIVSLSRKCEVGHNTPVTQTPGKQSPPSDPYSLFAFVLIERLLYSTGKTSRAFQRDPFPSHSSLLPPPPLPPTPGQLND